MKTAIGSVAIALAGMLAGCVGPPPATTPPASTEFRPLPDPQSYSRPEDIKVEHLSLDLEVDFARKELRGKATLRLLNRARTTLMTLDTRDLTITRVTRDGGATLQFRVGPADETLGAPLQIFLTPGTSAVTIEYKTSPGASALQWLDPVQTAGRRHPFLLSQSQSIHARSWVPIQDTPAVRFTYDATIRVPSELLAVMSAENPQQRNANGGYTFRMPQPIPAYLLAIAVGDLEFRPLSANTGVYAEPLVIAKAVAEFSDLPKMMAAAEALYGPYRWGRYDVLVLPPSFPFGGMENPRLTFLTPTIITGDRSLVSTVAHELAHSWSGNLVTNATWGEFWLNEGFTTYIEHRIAERIYGRDHAEMLWMLSMNDMRAEMAQVPIEDTKLVLDLTGRSADDLPTWPAYVKGALLVRLIEETAGREDFDRFLRLYFDTFAFQPMTSQKFVDFLREHLPAARGIDFDAWLYRGGLPASAPVPQSDVFTRVETQSRAFEKGAAPASLATAGWTTFQWLHFLQNLPPGIGAERLRDLDAQFHFTDSGNSELLEAWLERSIENGYTAARTALERFLTSQGRAKYVKPLYQKLAATPEGMAFARRVYAIARPGYHPMVQGMVDRILVASR